MKFIHFLQTTAASNYHSIIIICITCSEPPLFMISPFDPPLCWSANPPWLRTVTPAIVFGWNWRAKIHLCHEITNSSTIKWWFLNLTRVLYHLKKHPSFVVVKSSHVLKKSFFQPCHQWLSPILNHGIPGVALSPLTRSSGFPLSHPTRWRWREHSKASDTSSSPGHTWKRFRDPDFFCPG